MAKSAPKPAETLPTTRIAVPKLLEILRAYAVAGEPGQVVTNEDVAKVIDLAEYTVTLAHAFFKDVGFLAKSDGGFIVANEVYEFDRAHDFNPQNAPTKLSPKLLNSWFGRCLVSRLRIRELSEDDAIHALADQSKATASYRENLDAILELLQLVGIIIRADGKVKLGPSAAISTPANEASKHSTETASNSLTEREAAEFDSKAVRHSERTSSEPGVSFNVNIQASMEEIGAWDPERISAFFAGLAQAIAAKKGI